MAFDLFGTKFDKDSIEINILCDRTHEQLTDDQVKSLQSFLKKCVEEKKLVKDYKLFLNEQIMNVEFEERLYKVLKNFENFVDGKFYCFERLFFKRDFTIFQFHRSLSVRAKSVEL